MRDFKPPASICGSAGRFESYLVENPEDRFSRDEAPLIMTLPGQFSLFSQLLLMFRLQITL